MWVVKIDVLYFIGNGMFARVNAGYRFKMEPFLRIKVLFEPIFLKGCNGTYDIRNFTGVEIILTLQKLW